MHGETTQKLILIANAKYTVSDVYNNSHFTRHDDENNAAIQDEFWGLPK